MIKPVSFLNADNRYNTRNQQANRSAFQNESTQLSGFEAGKAILARNNISFRNLSTPIEITDRYNKPISGMDHLDLPNNIHVYEYPDTNLRVLINSNDDIDYPQSFTIIENSNYSEHNMVKEKLMQMVLEDKIPNLLSDNFTMSSASIDEISLSGISDFNKAVTNFHLEEEELENAKNRLSAEIIDDKFKKEFTNDFYKSEDLKTTKDILKEINNINKKELENYYQNYLKNSCIQTFITVPQEFFNKNKNEFLTALNKNLDCKFLNNQEAGKLAPEFIKEKEFLVNNKMYLSIPSANTKDILIEKFVTQILNSEDKFQYNTAQKNFSYPIALKNNSDLKHHMEFLVISPKDQSKSFDKDEYIKGLNEICNTDLEPSLNKAKKNCKEAFAKTFTNKTLDLIKNFELMKYQTDIFSIYETIDSISEEDIKKYIDEYLKTNDKKFRR